jgi:hypothetical protein
LMLTLPNSTAAAAEFRSEVDGLPSPITTISPPSPASSAPLGVLEQQNRMQLQHREKHLLSSPSSPTSRMEMGKHLNHSRRPSPSNLTLSPIETQRRHASHASVGVIDTQHGSGGSEEDGIGTALAPKGSRTLSSIAPRRLMGGKTHTAVAPTDAGSGSGGNGRGGRKPSAEAAYHAAMHADSARGRAEQRRAVVRRMLRKMNLPCPS